MEVCEAITAKDLILDLILNEKVTLQTMLTRKSSCVNARGIPPAAYQVLHLLSYPRVGYPHPDLAGGGGRGGWPISGWRDTPS